MILFFFLAQSSMSLNNNIYPKTFQWPSTIRRDLASQTNWYAAKTSERSHSLNWIIFVVVIVRERSQFIFHFIFVSFQRARRQFISET